MQGMELLASYLTSTCLVSTCVFAGERAYPEGWNVMGKSQSPFAHPTIGPLRLL
jgi:hypothetical protein